MLVPSKYSQSTFNMCKGKRKEFVKSFHKTATIISIDFLPDHFRMWKSILFNLGRKNSTDISQALFIIRSFQ